jgi:hypothetical protein
MGIPEHLRERVQPAVLAGARTLPVHPLLADLFPDGGLRRGSVIGCDGPGACSLALALVAQASQEGAWVGVVGLADLGVAAAVEAGVAMERVVRIAPGPGAPPATVLSAVLDGVEVVLAAAQGISAADARRLTARLTGRGGVLVVVGSPGAFSPDLVCTMPAARWEGLGNGAGRLVARRATLQSAGRRAGRPRRVELWFPAAAGGLLHCAADEVAAPAVLTRAG